MPNKCRIFYVIELAEHEIKNVFVSIMPNNGSADTIGYISTPLIANYY